MAPCPCGQTFSCVKEGDLNSECGSIWQITQLLLHERMQNGRSSRSPDILVRFVGQFDPSLGELHKAVLSEDEGACCAKRMVSAALSR
jgi:hypothetical protein